MANAVSARFNIRVYGIWIRDSYVLISEENSHELSFIKYPGGGLQFGEGIAECLYREFMEELAVVPQKHELFFVNENYVQSAFLPEDQIVSLYFRVWSDMDPNLDVITENRHEKEFKVHAKWMHLSELNPALFYFPIDKKVTEKIIGSY